MAGHWGPRLCDKGAITHGFQEITEGFCALAQSGNI